jgi:DNA polymerase
MALYRYCGQDIVAEDNASAHIPDLTPYELDMWLTDQTINARGVQVDTDTLGAALDILGQTERRYNQELAQLTDGSVQAASELAKMQNWLGGVHGVLMPDMKAETITETLQNNVDMNGGPLPPQARRALEIRDTLGAANVKKLRTLKLQVSSDGRLRNQYMYCGADRTGRASAGGVQLQNITAKGPKTCRCGGCGKIFGVDAKASPGCPRCGQFVDIEAQPEWTIEAVEQAIEDIARRDLDYIEYTWGDPIALLCGCLRGLFIAKEGHKLICCDFSAIEAVAAACLARCQWRIEIFSGHGKIYEQSAANATGIPFEEILQYKKDNGMHHPARKTIGKVRELAGGYGGWIGAWKNFGADKFMNDDEIKTDVLKWRDESPEFVEMWGGQFRWCGPGKRDYRPELFGLEGAVISAILHPGQCFSHIDITYGVKDDILFCRLPSGRYLHYHRPRLVGGVDKLKRGPCYKITFEGYNSNSTKGPIGWHRLETYGGRLFENVVQAVAADIQFEALGRCESRGYPIVMHTHDEGSAEVPLGFGSVEEMAAILSERPAWASWWPLRAAGWEHKRYQKD